MGSTLEPGNRRNPGGVETERTVKSVENQVRVIRLPRRKFTVRRAENKTDDKYTTSQFQKFRHSFRYCKYGIKPLGWFRRVCEHS